MANIAELVTRFVADTKQFIRETTKVEQKTQRLGDTTKQTGKSFGGLNAGMLASGAAMVGVVVAVKTVIDIVAKAIKVFAQFEQSMANVRAVTKATDLEFYELEQAAKNAGETTRFSANQAADALYYLASAGFDAKQSADALNSVLLLTGATNSDLASTAATLTAVLSQYSIEAADGERVSNVFAAAIGNSQATMEKLSNSFRQVGPVAAGLGVSLEETVGALQVLYNAGFRGEEAGRALKSALADLANESSATNKKLKTLGVSFEDVNPEVNSFAEIIGNLEDAGLETAETIEVFGKIAGPHLTTLINEGEQAIRNYTDAVTGTQEAVEQYNIQNDTLQGDIDILKSTVQSLGIEFGEALAPSIRIVVRWITDLVVFLKPLLVIIGKIINLVLVLSNTLVGPVLRDLSLLGTEISNLLDRFDLFMLKLEGGAENANIFGKALLFVKRQLEKIANINKDAMKDADAFEKYQNEHYKALNKHWQQYLDNQNELTKEEKERREKLSEEELKQLQETIEKRIEAEEKYTEAKRSADIQLREGLINQRQYNDELIASNKQLLTSLIDIGYDGLEDNIGGNLFRTVIKQIEELNSANEKLSKSTDDLINVQNDAKQSADIRLREGMINQRQYNDELIMANEQLLNSLIDIGYDGLEDNLNHDLFQKVKNEIEELTEANKKLEASAKNAFNAELIKEYAASIPGQVQTILQAISGLYKADTDRKLRALDIEKDARIAAGEDEVKIAEDIAKRKAQIEFSGAQAAWKLQLAAAIAGGAQAVINGLQTKPFIPLGIIAGGIAAALAGIQIAVVAKQRPQKTFATGAKNFIVPEGYPNDSYQIGLTSGERVTVETRNEQIVTNNNETVQQNIAIYFNTDVLYESINRGLADRKIRIP